MTRKEVRADQPVSVIVYGRRQPFAYTTTTPEDLGRFAFPPIAALITAAARLMLALLERCVSEAGGTYVFCDTDSMAIVASETGGHVPCAGGPYRLSDGTPAVQALSWREVDSIVERFAALNPYDRSTVPGSILKVEDVNFTDDTRAVRRRLFACSISAKRYALFTIGPDGEPAIHENKEHGLGHLLNPIDPDREDRDWTRQVWEVLVREALGVSAASPAWSTRPAVMRSAVTTPDLLRRFERFNKGKPYGSRGRRGRRWRRLWGIIWSTQR